MHVAPTCTRILSRIGGKHVAVTEAYAASREVEGIRRIEGRLRRQPMRLEIPSPRRLPSITEAQNCDYGGIRHRDPIPECIGVAANSDHALVIEWSVDAQDWTARREELLAGLQTEVMLDECLIRELAVRRF